jgi:putative flippase GtrA
MPRSGQRQVATDEGLIPLGGSATNLTLTGSMAQMQPPPSGTSNPIERRLEGLSDHRTLGLPVRFYFRRREQVLYLVVGGWNTVFGYAVWALLQYLLGDHLHYLVVVLIAWPIAVLNAYLGYRYVVFRSRGPILKELPRFSLVYFVTLIVNLALLPVALNVLPFNIYVVQALLTAIVVVCSYLSHRYYSFGGGRRENVPGASFYDPPATPED